MPQTGTDQAAPEVVYHYTTVDAMMKIVSSASIWATSITYLNDTAEREHYLGLVRERIPALLAAREICDAAVFENLLAGSSTDFTSRPFVASFSRDPDSLPQWRSYCPNGNGVSIGFRVDCLKRAFVKPDSGVTGNLVYQPGLSFMPVEYVGKDALQTIDLDIVKGVAGASVLARQMNETRGGSHTPADYLGVMLERRACFVKHTSFESESEHRILVDGVFMNLQHLRFRSTRSSLVPYLVVEIPRFHSRYTGTSPLHNWSPLAGRWDFVDRVIVGPTTNGNLTLEAVKAFFNRESMHVDVELSSVPYRDW